jgi:isocitrate lyase
VHYVTPTELNKIQAERMKDLGIYYEVNTEVGEIIVAIVNLDFVKELLNPDQVELKKLISKS